MKKITDKALYLAVAMAIGLLCACQGGDQTDENTKTEAEILQEVTFVHAIGKVSPAADWVVISSPITARVQQLNVAEGDSVVSGQLLMVLENGTAALEVEAAKARWSSLRAEHHATRQDLEKARVAAEELERKYRTSQVLFEQHAETRETRDSDYSAWQQQELTVRSLQDKIKAQEINEKEQHLQIQTAEAALADFRITAPKGGIVVDLTAQLGQSVSSTDELAKIVDVQNPIVEAEVDELFVNDVQVGQEVSLSTVGRADTVARGIVSYCSPILSDKSILYETANEGADRRVRRVKIKLTSGQIMPINAKVDCRIKIR